MRAFTDSFRRVQAGPWAGDAAPAGVQVLNVPATGVGVVYRMSALVGDLSAFSKRLQGYFVSSVGGLTATMQLYVADGSATGAPIWIAVGDPLTAIPQNRLFVSSGFVGDADVLIAITPSAALAGAGDTLTLYLEAIGS